MEELARILGTHSSIELIWFKGDLVGDTAASNLAAAFKTNTHITDVLLSFPNINTTEAAELGTAIETTPTINTVCLDHMSFIDDAGARQLVKMIGKNSCVETFVFQNIEFGIECCKDLSTSLDINTSVCTLEFTDCKIGDGFKYLSAMIEQNINLTILILVRVGKIKSANLGEVVNTKSITTLDISENDAGNAEARELATALKTNSSITTLIANRNNIHNSGAKDIATALLSNSTLTHLELCGNKIGNKGASSFGNLLEENSTIVHLDLSLNPKIKNKGARNLISGLKSNTVIQELKLGSRGAFGLKREFFREISIALEANKNVEGSFLRAVQNHSLMMITALLDRGADVNVVDEEGYSALYHAINQTADYTTVEHLLKNGANPNIVDKDERGVLWHTVDQHHDIKIIELLLHHSADPTAKDKNGHTPLWLAITQATPEITAMTRLICHQLNVNPSRLPELIRSSSQLCTSVIAVLEDVLRSDKESDTVRAAATHVLIELICGVVDFPFFSAEAALVRFLGEEGDDDDEDEDEDKDEDEDESQDIDITTNPDTHTKYHTDIHTKGSFRAKAEDLLITQLVGDNTKHRRVVANVFSQLNTGGREHVWKKCLCLCKQSLPASSANAFPRSFKSSKSSSLSSPTTSTLSSPTTSLRGSKPIVRACRALAELETVSIVFADMYASCTTKTTHVFVNAYARGLGTSDTDDRAALLAFFSLLGDTARDDVISICLTSALCKSFLRLETIDIKFADVYASRSDVETSRFAQQYAELLVFEDSVTHGGSFNDRSTHRQGKGEHGDVDDGDDDGDGGDDGDADDVDDDGDDDCDGDTLTSALELFSRLSTTAIIQLESSDVPEVAKAAEVALMPVDDEFNPFDPLLLAQQLGVVLGSNSVAAGAFNSNGYPLPNIFHPTSTTRTPVAENNIRLAATAMAFMFDRQIEHEVSAWHEINRFSDGFMTGLDVTKFVERHLARYLDTPIDSLQTYPNVATMEIPRWYDEVLVQPAIISVCKQLSLRKQAALDDVSQIEACQTLAKESLKADQAIYGGAIMKAEQNNTAATVKMRALAQQKQLEIHDNWKLDNDSGELKRPTHEGLPQHPTAATVKLQAVQQGADFRKVIEKIRSRTGLKVTMTRGKLDIDSGVLVKIKHNNNNNNNNGDNNNNSNTSGKHLYLSKGGFRIAQKLWVRGDVHTICDINRALLEADNYEAMLNGAAFIFSFPLIEVVDVKDRVNNPTSGGWSDLVVLFRVKGGGGHIHELQLALSTMMVARGAMNAHDAYARARYYIELLFKCGCTLDAESSEQKVMKMNSLQTKVISDQKQENLLLSQEVLHLQTENANLVASLREIQEELHSVKDGKGKGKRRYSNSNNSNNNNNNNTSNTNSNNNSNSTLARRASTSSTQYPHFVPDHQTGQSLCGWLLLLVGKKQKKRRWFVLKEGWFTYHDTNKITLNTSLLTILKTSKEALRLGNCKVQPPHTATHTDTSTHTVGDVDSVDNVTKTTEDDVKKANTQTFCVSEDVDSAITMFRIECENAREWVDALLTHQGCEQDTSVSLATAIQVQSSIESEAFQITQRISTTSNV